ncbi:MAG: glycosyltransferase family 2 protein, partial [Gammaproteobacteria bacterium]
MTSAGGDPANHRVSVVIATRERPEAVVQAVRSALAVDAATIEVVVVDQSQVPLTRGALIERLGTPPPGRSLTVEGSTRRGVSAGRNRGISLATGELILITDDDCTLATNTVSALRTAFGADKRIGIVYGNVRAIDHDRALGFVPSYHRSEPFLAQGLEDKHLVEGLSACMGLRKRIWEELGGFDEQLGVGSAFGSGAENDLAIRALVAGHLVYE